MPMCNSREQCYDVQGVATISHNDSGQSESPDWPHQLNIVPEESGCRFTSDDDGRHVLQRYASLVSIADLLAGHGHHPVIECH